MDSKIIINNDRVVTNLLKRENERQFEIQKKRNEKKLINPKHEQYNYFRQVFQDKINQIELSLEQLDSIQQNQLAFHFDKIWKELHALQKFIADSLLFLREYDIKKCQKNLQEIEIKTRKLEENLLPKKKFGFKNKRPPISSSTFEHKDPIIKHDETDGNLLKKLTINNFIDNNFNGFKNEKNATLILTSENIYKKDVSLQNLEKCLVQLNGTASTLHMSNLENCVILCGPVATSVFIENCKNSKIAIACQQLRLHSSNNCDIYLHVTSKAIIEDSSQINVTEYNYNYEQLGDDFEKSHLDKNTNNWSKIDDFNWLVVDKKSPNWNVLDENTKITNWNNYYELKQNK